MAKRCSKQGPQPVSNPRQCGDERGTEKSTEAGQGQWMQKNPGAAAPALALPLLGSVTLKESLTFLSLSFPTEWELLSGLRLELLVLCEETG